MAKIALLIGVSEYQEGLSPLPSAVKDIEAVRRVFQNPDVGGFDEVNVLANPDPMAMQEAIEALFSSRNKDDLALLFFSGHGVKDDGGRLYFATRATRKNPQGDLVKATAVPASFVQDIMSNARCKRQVVILDCCFSGAFAEGMTAKDDGVVDIQTQLGGEGRAVLTSSTSTQYSFEQHGSDLSVYTQYIVEGMESGAADLDSDGSISIDELHDYARKKVQETAPAMKPKIYIVEEGFKIRLAKVRIGDPKLAYRKEVERRASRGAISSLGRRILDDLRDNLALSPDHASAIEEEVLKPYREYQKKLQRYDQAFAEAIGLENPIGETTREELHRYQEILGLREEDVLPIEAKYGTSKKEPIKPQLTTTETPQQETKDSSTQDVPAPPSPTLQPRPQPQQHRQPQALQQHRQEVSTKGEPMQVRPLDSSQPVTSQIRNSSKLSISADTTAQVETTSSGKPSKILITGGIAGIAVSILGLFSLVAAPSFLNQATKAKQAEAKQYVGSMNRGQQAYFLEKNQFAADIPALLLGINSETSNYSYKTQAYNSGKGSYAISTATPKQTGLKSYVGGAFLSYVAANEPTTVAIVCESTQPSDSPPAAPKLANGEPQCSPGSTNASN